MRQSIFIIILVGAAFLGGAFVNGPGLQWAQARILRTLGLSNGGEIAAVDLTSNTSGDPSPDAANPSKSLDDLPSGVIGSMPPVAARSNSLTQNASNRPSESRKAVQSSEGGFGSAQSQLLSLPSATSIGSVMKSSPHGPAPLDPQLKPAGAESPPRSPRPGAQADTRSVPALLNSPVALLPADDSLSDSPTPQGTRLTSGTKLPAGADDEWALLESKMQSLGVSRFTVEGKPGGHVVFACLIPLAGRQAITQRFKAEGEDMIQTAHAAVRCIVLWRGTQVPQMDGTPAVEKTNR